MEVEGAPKTDPPAQEAAADGTVAQVADGSVPPNPLVDKYLQDWQAVQEKPNDFQLWCALINSAEKLDDLERMRAVYEPFLVAYPLCYGYWKKYADAEHRHGSVEAAVAVYERGVAATPYSMDLWIHFSTYQKANGGSPEQVRGIFERALAYCGSDYVAHSLWDKYIHFEEEQGSGQHVAALYTRALGQPLRELPRYWSSLQAFLQGRSPSEFMSPDESEALTASVSASKQSQATAAREAAEAAAAAGENGAAPGEVPPVDTSVTDEDIKDAWLKQREAAYATGRALAEARKPYEEGIKRAYFHVKPLDAAQLTNWLRYLDFMEAQPDSLAATVFVYERCLVACASYPEFWERYVRYLEAKGMQPEAEAALQRGLFVFCKHRPEMHLFAARYSERHGRVEEARERFTSVLTEVAPRLIQAIVAAANFERRQGNLEAARNHYESVLKSERGEGDKGSSKMYPALAMQYSLFLQQVCKDVERAREVLHEAVAAAPHIRGLYEAAILLEESTGLHHSPEAIQRVKALLDKAIAEPAQDGPQGLSEKDREELSLRAIELADMHGDPAAILAAEARHVSHFQLPASIGASAAAAASGGDRAAGQKRYAEGEYDAQGKAQRTDTAGYPQAAAGAAAAAGAGATGAAAAGTAAQHAAYAYPGYGQYGQYGAHYAGYGAQYPAGYGYGQYAGYGY